MASKLLTCRGSTPLILYTVTLRPRQVLPSSLFFSSAPSKPDPSRLHDSPSDVRATAASEDTPNGDLQSQRDDLESLRDVSRMEKRYRDRMLHVMEPPEPPNYIAELFQSQGQRRKLYAKYGRKLGVDPGVMWPSEKELNEKIEFEKDWEPSLQQRWKKLEEDRAQLAKERREKNELVEKQMAKMPSIINQYRARLAKADEAERKQQEKKQQLMEQAREFFGYALDPKDPRFEQMQLEKEEEEKKLKKKKKREEKQAKLMSLLKS